MLLRRARLEHWCRLSSTASLCMESMGWGSAHECSAVYDVHVSYVTACIIRGSGEGRVHLFQPSGADEMDDCWYHPAIRMAKQSMMKCATPATIPLPHDLLHE